MSNIHDKAFDNRLNY